jgi:hypothetical protein
MSDRSVLVEETQIPPLALQSATALTTYHLEGDTPEFPWCGQIEGALPVVLQSWDEPTVQLSACEWCRIKAIAESA